MRAKDKTIQHISNVNKVINVIVDKLVERGEKHDLSRLESPEVEVFGKNANKKIISDQNSPEYYRYVDRLKNALIHHQEHNRHHPEFFDNGIDGMNLIDLLEMFCDWRASCVKHGDEDIEILRRIEVNKKRFNISDQLTNVFKNTIKVTRISESERN